MGLEYGRKRGCGVGNEGMGTREISKKKWKKTELDRPRLGFWGAFQVWGGRL